MRIRLRATRKALCVLVTTTRGTRRNPPRWMPSDRTCRPSWRSSAHAPRASISSTTSNMRCEIAAAGISTRQVTGVGAAGERSRCGTFPGDQEGDVERSAAGDTDATGRQRQEQRPAGCRVGTEADLGPFASGPEAAWLGRCPAGAECAVVAEVGDLHRLADAEQERLAPGIPPLAPPDEACRLGEALDGHLVHALSELDRCAANTRMHRREAVVEVRVDVIAWCTAWCC